MASSQVIPFLGAKIAPSPEWNGRALQYWPLSLQNQSGELISPTAQFLVLFALESMVPFLTYMTTKLILRRSWIHSPHLLDLLRSPSYPFVAQTPIHCAWTFLLRKTPSLFIKGISILTNYPSSSRWSLVVRQVQRKLRRVVILLSDEIKITSSVVKNRSQKIYRSSFE